MENVGKDVQIYEGTIYKLLFIDDQVILAKDDQEADHIF